MTIICKFKYFKSNLITPADDTDWMCSSRVHCYMQWHSAVVERSGINTIICTLLRGYQTSNDTPVHLSLLLNQSWIRAKSCAVLTNFYSLIALILKLLKCC